MKLRKTKYFLNTYNEAKEQEKETEKREAFKPFEPLKIKNAHLTIGIIV